MLLCGMKDFEVPYVKRSNALKPCYRASGIFPFSTTAIKTPLMPLRHVNATNSLNAMQLTKESSSYTLTA
jgi:hypothetical protein